MWNVPEKYLYIYQHFVEGEFVVRIAAGHVKAVAADIKSEQSIQSPKKGPGGITGQTKQQAYITESDLAYHEVLKISRCFNNLTRSYVTEADAALLYKELRKKNILEYKKGVENAYKFLNDRGNPHRVAAATKLYHTTSKQVVLREKTMEIVTFLENGFSSYLLFRKERLQEKTKKLAHSIRRVNAPSFMPEEDTTNNKITFQAPKISTKSLGTAQKNTEIACSRRFTNTELLQYDFPDSLIKKVDRDMGSIKQ